MNTKPMNTKPMNSQSHPEAYEAMNAAAKQFWAYPNLEWQDNFLEQWLLDHPEQS